MVRFPDDPGRSFEFQPPRVRFIVNFDGVVSRRIFCYLLGLVILDAAGALVRAARSTGIRAAPFAG